jgi:hypothetical protein
MEESRRQHRVCGEKTQQSSAGERRLKALCNYAHHACRVRTPPPSSCSQASIESMSFVAPGPADRSKRVYIHTPPHHPLIFDIYRLSVQARMKTVALAAVAALGCANAFLLGSPLNAAPKSQVCSSTTRMAVALPPLPCKLIDRSDCLCAAGLLGPGVGGGAMKAGTNVARRGSRTILQQ